MEIDSGSAAVVASIVSLGLGLASIRNTRTLARSAAAEARAARRSEACLDLLRLVESIGLATQDEMYNLTETEHEDFPHVVLPKRKIEGPERKNRAEALALIGAYGSKEIRVAYEKWIATVDQWEDKTVGWNVEFQTNGEFDVSTVSAEPERATEVKERRELSDVVGKLLAAK